MASMVACAARLQYRQNPGSKEGLKEKNKKKKKKDIEMADTRE